MKMIVVTVVVAALAFTLLSFNQNFDLKASVARGKEVYITYCYSCHMSEGQGIEAVFPPLANQKILPIKTV